MSSWSGNGGRRNKLVKYVPVGELSVRLGGWLDLPSDATCCGETVGLTNRFVASNDFRGRGGISTVSEIEGRASKDKRGRDLTGCSMTTGYNAVDLGADSG